MACIKGTTVYWAIFLTLYGAVFSQVEAYNQCYSDSGCSGLFTQYCCERKYEDNVCRYSCVGQSCNFNSDCAPDECCDSDDTCTTADCDVIKGLAGWIVAVIVISIIVVIVIPIAVVVFCCCCAAGAAASSRRPAHGGVIVAQPATTGTTVIASQQQQQLYPAQQGQPMYFQNPQQYSNQPPPHQPQGTVYPPEGSGPPMAMTPQVKQ